MGIEWIGQVLSGITFRRDTVARAVSIVPVGMYRLQMPAGYRWLLSLGITNTAASAVKA